jgi:hypothetical protein
MVMADKGSLELLELHRVARQAEERINETVAPNTIENIKNRNLTDIS